MEGCCFVILVGGPNRLNTGKIDEENYKEL
jgi:hypothetical protein